MAILKFTVPIDTIEFTSDFYLTKSNAFFSLLTLGAFEIDWHYGGNDYESWFYNTGPATLAGDINGLSGTVGGYSVYKNDTGFPLWSISNISVSAATLYAPFLTPSTVDDNALIKLVLAGDDSITGSTGNDTLSGYGGNDTIEGGGGTDIAAYSGHYSDYSFRLGPSNSLSVTDNRVGSPDGSDTLYEISDLQFADKTVAVSTMTSLLNMPDLVARNVTLHTPVILPGGTLDFNFDISNLGPNASHAGNVGFYVSKDNIITTSDISVGTDSGNPLLSGKGGTSTTADWLIDLSQNPAAAKLAPGTYYFGVIADVDKQIGESSETNNASQGVAFTIRSPLPDLAITDGGLDNAEVQAGGLLSGHFTISNLGPTPVNPGNIGIYLSKDATITASDTLISTAVFPSLLIPGDGNEDIALSRYLPGNVAPGNYFVGVIVDYDKKVVEASDTNNISSGQSVTIDPFSSNVIKWNAAVSDGFENNARWAGGVVPSPDDTAALTAPGASYAVTTTDDNVKALITAKNATLDVLDNFIMTSGTGAGANAGTITIENGGALAIAGIVNNSGSIKLQGNGDATSLMFDDGTVLAGHGKLTLSDDSNNSINGTTLVNVDNTISGAGSIGGDVFNQLAGIVSATGVNPLVLDGSSFINAGTLRATGMGALLIEENIENTSTGVIQAIGAGAHVDLEATTIVGGTLKTDNAGVIRVVGVNEYSWLDGSVSKVTVAGNLSLGEDTNLQIFGTITNTGTIALNSTSTGLDGVNLTFADSTTLSGGGKILLSDSAYNFISLYGAPVTSDNLISGAGDLNFSSFTNLAKGVINASAASNALNVFSGAAPDQDLTNAGLIEATGAGGLILWDGISNSSSGVIAAMAGSHIELHGTDIVGGNVATAKNASIVADNVNPSTISGAKITNGGTLGADSADLTINGGLTNNGMLSVANNGHLDISGAVAGKGTATIASHGILEFGAAAPGAVTFLDDTGRLQLDTATKTTAKFTGTISGFQHGDHIELGAIAFTSGDAELTNFVANKTGGVLTVDDGSHSIGLTLVGHYALTDFHTANLNGHLDLLHV